MSMLKCGIILLNQCREGICREGIFKNRSQFVAVRAQKSMFCGRISPIVWRLRRDCKLEHIEEKQVFSILASKHFILQFIKSSDWLDAELGMSKIRFHKSHVALSQICPQLHFLLHLEKFQEINLLNGNLHKTLTQQHLREFLKTTVSSIVSPEKTLQTLSSQVKQNISTQQSKTLVRAICLAFVVVLFPVSSIF